MTEWTPELQERFLAARRRSADTAQAQANVAANLGTDPDKAAETNRLSKQSGVPSELIEVNPKDWKDRLTTNTNSELAERSERIRKYILANPAAAKVSKDDMQSLDRIGRRVDDTIDFNTPFDVPGAITTPGQKVVDTGPGFTTEVVEGYRATEYGRKAFRYWLGDKSVQPDLEAYEKEQEGKPKSGTNYMSRLFGNLLGSMASSAPVVAGTTAAGAGIGAGVGAIAGGIGAVPGAIGGASAGFATGFAADQAMTVGGQVYRNLDLVRDSKGQPIPEHIKQQAAAAAFLAGGALGYAGGKLTADVTAKAFTKVLSDEAARQVVTRYVQSATAAGVHGGMINGFTQLAQEMADQWAKVVSGLDLKTIGNDPKEVQAVAERLGQAVIDGLVLGGTLGALGEVPRKGNPVGDALLTDQARLNQQRLDGLMKESWENKTRQRDPDMFSQFLKQGKDADVTLPLEVVQPLQDKFAWIPDLDKQIETAARTGTEIVMPVSGFAAYVDDATYAAVRDHVRHHDGGVTLAEVTLKEVAAKEAAEAAKPVETGEVAVRPVTERPTPAADVSKAAEPYAPREAPQQLELPLERPAEVVVPSVEAIERQLFAVTEPRKATPEEISAAQTAQNLAILSEGLKQLPIKEPIQGQLPIPEPPPKVVPTPLPEALGDPVDSVLIPAHPKADAAVAGDVPTVARTPPEPPPSQVIQILERADIIPLLNDAEKTILYEALEKRPKSLAELDRQMDDVAATYGVSPEQLQGVKAGIEAAIAEAVTEQVKAEGAAVVNGLTDKDAQYAARRTGVSIDEKRQAMWLTPLFEGAKAVGMSAQRLAAYSRNIMEVQRKLTQAVWDAAHEEIKRKETQAWKSTSELMRPEVELEVRQQPDIMASTYLRLGKGPDGTGETFQVKLHRQDVDTLFTTAEQKAMGIEGKISEALPGSMFGGPKNRIPVDELSSVFGYKSGKEMVKALIEFHQGLKSRGMSAEAEFHRRVDEEVNKRMVAQYGNLEEIIIRRSTEAAMDVAQVKVFAKELQELRDRARIEERLDIGEIKARVEQEFSRMSLKDATAVERYQHAAGRFGEAAESALLRATPDPVTAFKAKQLQYMQFEMARAAAQLRREGAEAKRLADRYSKKSEGRKVTDAEFNTRIQQLLSQTGLGIRRNADELARAITDTGEPSLNSWIAGEVFRSGNAIPEASYLDNPAFNKSDLTKMAVSDFREFHATLKALDYAGRQAKKIGVAENKIDLDLGIAEVKRSIVSLNRPEVQSELTRYRKGVGDFWKEQLRRLNSSLLKAETLITNIDHWQADGPLTRYLLRPFYEAEARKDGMLKKAVKAIEAADDPETHATRKKLVENTTLLDPRTQKPMNIDRDMMLQIALNWGTETNRKKLLDGYNWNKDHVQELLNREMTDRNWKWVQAIWDVFRELKPEADRTYRNIRGYGMKYEEGVPIFTPFGKIDGGYYPLMAVADDTNAPNSKDLFERRQFNGLPSNDYTKDRTGKTYQVRLEGDLLPHRMREMIHDIAYREASINANKIVNHKGFVDAVNQSFGKEYSNMLKDWVKDVANDGGYRDERGVGFFYNTYRHLMKNSVVASIGFNLGTVAIHSTSAAVNTIKEVGALPFLASASRLTKDRIISTVERMFRSPENLERAHKFAWDNSPELQRRWRSTDRDVRHALGQWGRMEQAQYTFGWWAQSIISATDYGSALVAWDVTYRRVMEEGKATHAEAVQRADKVVRESHGGTALIDRSAIQRSQAFGPFTQFYGYWNHNYNQHYAEIQKLKTMSRDRKSIDKGFDDMLLNVSRTGQFWEGFKYLTAYLVVPAIIHEVIRGHWSEEDSWGKIAAKMMASQVAGGVPLMRDAVYAWLHPKAPTSLPGMGLFGALAQGQRKASRAMETGEWQNMVQPAISTFGYALGLGTNTIAKWSQYAVDVATGAKDAPHDPSDYWRTIIYGESHPPGHKKAEPSSRPGWMAR